MSYFIIALVLMPCFTFLFYKMMDVNINDTPEVALTVALGATFGLAWPVGLGLVAFGYLFYGIAKLIQKVAE